jgi:hypothetical protein
VATRSGGAAPHVDRLILEAATGARQLSQDELRHVLQYVAQAGFDPHARETVRGPLAGIEWGGRILRGVDRLPPAERHYLRHAVLRAEWPAGATLADYVESIRGVILDGTSGVFTNRYQGAWHLGVVRQSRELRGPRGYEWVLVQYRVALGHWVTAFQLRDGLAELAKPQWDQVRWLRQPRSSSESSST